MDNKYNITGNFSTNKIFLLMKLREIIASICQNDKNRIYGYICIKFKFFNIVFQLNYNSRMYCS